MCNNFPFTATQIFPHPSVCSPQRTDIRAPVCCLLMGSLVRPILDPSTRGTVQNSSSCAELSSPHHHTHSGKYTSTTFFDQALQPSCFPQEYPPPSPLPPPPQATSSTSSPHTQPLHPILRPLILSPIHAPLLLSHPPPPAQASQSQKTLPTATINANSLQAPQRERRARTVDIANVWGRVRESSMTICICDSCGSVVELKERRIAGWVCIRIKALLLRLYSGCTIVWANEIELDEIERKLYSN